MFPTDGANCCDHKYYGSNNNSLTTKRMKRTIINARFDYPVQDLPLFSDSTTTDSPKSDEAATLSGAILKGDPLIVDPMPFSSPDSWIGPTTSEKLKHETAKIKIDIALFFGSVWKNRYTSFTLAIFILCLSRVEWSTSMIVPSSSNSHCMKGSFHRLIEIPTIWTHVVLADILSWNSQVF